MFRFKWLRRFVRKHTNPIPADRAVSVKRKLSFLYMILTWNAFGIVCYMIYTGRLQKSEADNSVPPAEKWARLLKIDRAKIVTFSSQKKSAYDYQSEDLMEERKETNKPE